MLVQLLSAIEKNFDCVRNAYKCTYFSEAAEMEAIITHNNSLRSTLERPDGELCGWKPSLRQRAKRSNQAERLTFHFIAK